MLSYQFATWRIQVCKGAYVDVSVSGSQGDRDTATCEDLKRAGAVLSQVAHSLMVIRDGLAAKEKP